MMESKYTKKSHLEKFLGYLIVYSFILGFLLLLAVPVWFILSRFSDQVRYWHIGVYFFAMECYLLHWDIFRPLRKQSRWFRISGRFIAGALFALFLGYIYYLMFM